MPRSCMLLVSALVMGLMAGPAAAQQPSKPSEPSAPSDLQKAREHYARAEQAMKSGDHVLAAGQYSKAYEITKDPVLFYKIASAHYEARNCADAVTYFTRYLDQGQPDEKFRALTQERIDECKARAAHSAGGAAGGSGGKPAGGQESSAPATGDSGAAAGTSSGADQAGDAARDNEGDAARDDEGDAARDDEGDAVGLSAGDAAGAAAGLPGGDGARPPSFADQEVTWQSKAAWVSVGLTATFVTAGAVLGLSASSREEDLRNLIEFRYPNGEPAIYAGNPRARYEDYVEEGERLAGYSRLALGAAGVAAVSATVFFILDARSSKEAARASARIGTEASTEISTELTPLATPHGLGMSAGWRF